MAYVDFQESKESEIWRKQIQVLAKYMKSMIPTLSQDAAWRMARTWIKENME